MYSNATHIRYMHRMGSVVLEVSVLDFVKKEIQMKIKKKEIQIKINIDRNWRIFLLEFF